MPNSLLESRYLFSEILLDNCFVNASLPVPFLLPSVCNSCKKVLLLFQNLYQFCDADSQIKTHSVHPALVNSTLTCSKNIPVCIQMKIHSRMGSLWPALKAEVWTWINILLLWNASLSCRRVCARQARLRAGLREGWPVLHLWLPPRLHPQPRQEDVLK